MELDACRFSVRPVATPRRPVWLVWLGEGRVVRVCGEGAIALTTVYRQRVNDASSVQELPSRCIAEYMELTAAQGQLGAGSAKAWNAKLDSRKTME